MLETQSRKGFWRFDHSGHGRSLWYGQWPSWSSKAFGGLAILVLEGRFAVATLPAGCRAKLPLLASRCILHHVLVHMPTSCPPITHTHCSYSMWKQQLCAGAGYDWPLVRGTQLAKMARVTPRLGNGPRFGTCSVLFHNIRQIFSLQLSCNCFPANVCTFL